MGFLSMARYNDKKQNCYQSGKVQAEKQNWKEIDIKRFLAKEMTHVTERIGQANPKSIGQAIRKGRKSRA